LTQRNHNRALLNIGAVAAVTERTQYPPMKTAISSTACVLLASVIGISDARCEETEAEWLLAATRSWIKPFAVSGAVTESIEEHEARRALVVEAVVKVAEDATMPNLFPNAKNGRALSALMVLSVFRFESRFDVRVQNRHCKGLPKESCDSGKAWCLGQIHPEDVPKLAELGWTGADLEADAEKCARATFWRLDASRIACSAVGLEGGDRFSSYATGKCEKGGVMQLRYGAATNWAAKHPAPVAPAASSAPAKMPPS
jgi:hypothetical protein